MSYKPLIKLLEEYNPTLEEVEAKNRIIQFILENDDCFERTLEIGHITASAWLLNENEDKALLMHHSKLNLWVQLGGHCDGEKDVLSVATKEAKEESGIADIIPLSNGIFDIDIHPIPTIHSENPHYHYDIRFLLKVIGNETLHMNHEAKELRWISKNSNDLPTVERSVIRMFEKWIKL